MKPSYTKEILQECANESFSLAQLISKLGIVPRGGNYKTIKKYIQQWNVNISHFTGQGHLKGKTHNYGKQKELSEILTEHSNYNSVSIRERLIKEKIFQHKCYRCNRIEWNDKQIPLELEHINGINTDNRLENLTLLCPNCHAQTDTYRGRNKKTSTLIKRSAVINRRKELYPFPKCFYCSNETKSRGAKYCSVMCARKHSKPPRIFKIVWPPMDELIKRLEEVPYTTLAKELGVSDNAIRKHIKKHQQTDIIP